MARRAEGWRLYLDARSGIYSVRWRSGGVRRHVSTGEKDPGEATKAATRIYAESVSGRRVDGQRRIGIAEAAAEWLAAASATLDETTVAKYEIYARTWAAAWGTIENVTARSVEDWWARRLGEVKRRTVVKQLYALGGMLAFCRARGWIGEVPRWDMPPRGKQGTPAKGSRPVEVVPLSEREAKALLAALPEWSDRSLRGGRGKWRVRDRFVVAWETALRPATLEGLRAPDDYRRGAATLKIRDEIDKVRFGRELPLTRAARSALDRCAPDVGQIFAVLDDHTGARYLRLAAVAAGLDAQKAERVKPYDLRHARLTHLAERAPNRVGVAFLAGHKSLTTTDLYVHASRRAAEEALRAIGTGSGRGRGREGSRKGGAG